MNDLTAYDGFHIHPANRKHHHTPGMIFDLMKRTFKFNGDEWEAFKSVTEYVTSLPMIRHDEPTCGSGKHRGLYSRDHLVDFLYEWILLGSYERDESGYVGDHDSWVMSYDYYMSRTHAPFAFWEKMKNWGFHKEDPVLEVEELSGTLQEALSFLELDELPKEIPKQQYYRMAAKYHPDVGGDHESFIKLKASYDLICREIESRT